jgi:hypothetical protein
VSGFWLPGKDGRAVFVPKTAPAPVRYTGWLEYASDGYRDYVRRLTEWGADFESGKTCRAGYVPPCVRFQKSLGSMGKNGTARTE